MRTSKAAVFAFALAFVLALSGAARATPNFPPFIQQDLGLAAEPHCAICHSDGDTGGLGTVNTPFGKNMRQRGLVHFDTGALKSALDQMTADDVNSAGDCLDDIDELKAGRDPNVPDDTCDGGGMITPSAGEGPSYGCGIAPADGTGGLDPSLFLALIFVVGSRKKKPPGRQPI